MKTPKLTPHGGTMLRSVFGALITAALVLASTHGFAKVTEPGITGVQEATHIGVQPDATYTGLADVQAIAFTDAYIAKTAEETTGTIAIAAQHAKTHTATIEGAVEITTSAGTIVAKTHTATGIAKEQITGRHAITVAHAKAAHYAAVEHIETP